MSSVSEKMQAAIAEMNAANTRRAEAAKSSKLRTQLGIGLDGVIDLSAHLLDFEKIEEALQHVFTAHGVPRLGGASGEMGWSSFSTLQRCPYLWMRTYRGGHRSTTVDLDIGSLFHTYAAVHYQRMIDPKYPLTPQIIHDRLLETQCSAAVIYRVWDYWMGYAAKYASDYLEPLAVEYLARDSVTGESCRYDLVARVSDYGRAMLVAGNYIVEHKTAAQFTEEKLYGWKNDGEIQGQIRLWDACGLSEKFNGPLEGVIVNVVGKQKIQQFHRTVVAPSRAISAQHIADLQYWAAYRENLEATGTWPRSRANCYNRHGKCPQFEHCAGGDEATPASELVRQ